YIWKRFMNPHDKTYRELMDDYKKEPMFHHKEQIMTVTDMAKDEWFSDERLLRRLIFENPVKKFELERGYKFKNYYNDCLDRALWIFDRDKLFNHGYLNAHCPRPYHCSIEEMAPLIEYINTTYP
ncbi:MAG: hypothetical protein NUV80_02725, partial [Candidatus Berkelbacteria bacterium]|nr:hypothetical protein [Candidatus Berkelbacteria bacterium]